METDDGGESILVVDDDLKYLKLIRALLQSEGYDVRTAADAEEALGVLEAFRPRLILMDVQLPGMNGLELTRRLKANTQTHEMTVVACTGWSMPEAEQNALDAGCDGYIAKPVDPRTLIRLVADYLQRAVRKQTEHC